MKTTVALSLVAAALAIPALAGTASSGLRVGEKVTPFHPTHVTGPDAGTDTCPPCKYQARPAVQVWVNGDDLKNVGAIAKVLNDSVKTYSKKEFKGFVIVLTSADKQAATAATLKSIAEKTGYKNIAMATLAKNDEAVTNYKFNLDSSVKNTVIVYKDWTVAQKFVNLKADAAGIGSLETAIKSVTK